jgi:hypothetical protein
MQKNNQKGMALTGWLIVITFMGFAFTFLLKLLPVYFEDYSIKQAFEKVVHEQDVKTLMPDQIREHFSKYLVTNSVSIVEKDKLVIMDKNNTRTMQLDYEVRKPFFANIDLILSFHYQETISLPS